MSLYIINPLKPRASVRLTDFNIVKLFILPTENISLSLCVCVCVCEVGMFTLERVPTNDCEIIKLKKYEENLFKRRSPNEGTSIYIISVHNVKIESVKTPFPGIAQHLTKPR
jgi:hypothetical protein